MKKFVSILCTAAMLVSAAVLPAAAAENAANYTITEDYYYKSDSSTVTVTPMKVTIVDGRPAIELKFTNSQTDFGIDFKNLDEGKYRLTAVYNLDTNPGDGLLALRRGTYTGSGGSGNSYPGNSPKSLINNTTKNEFVQATADYNVQDQATDKELAQFARIRFANGGKGDGTPGTCYIAEFKLQKILNDDGTQLGDNLLPDLFVKTEEPEKKLTLNALTAEENDGAFNQGFVTDSNFKGSDYQTLVVGYSENNDKEYKAYKLPTTITGDGNVQLGVEIQNIPSQYKDGIEVYLTNKTAPEDAVTLQ